MQNSKVLLKIWQMLKKIVRDQKQFWKHCCVQDSLLGVVCNLWGQLYLRAVVPQSGCSRAFFLRTRDHATFYIATPKTFRIISSTLFVPLETVLLALIFWKLWDFRKLLTKYMLTFEGFVVGSLENFPLSNNKWPNLVKMSLRWNLRQCS